MLEQTHETDMHVSGHMYSIPYPYLISTTCIISYNLSLHSQMGSECHYKLNSQMRGFTTFVLDKVLLQWRESYSCCLKEAAVSLISLLWHSNFLPEIFFQILDPNPRNLNIMIPGLLQYWNSCVITPAVPLPPFNSCSTCIFSSFKQHSFYTFLQSTVFGLVLFLQLSPVRGQNLPSRLAHKRDLK